MKPITRIEMYLAAIAGDEDAITPLPEPVTRIETYLASLAGENVVLPEPVTRVEMYLAALCGMSVELPEDPYTRIEFYLAILNGETIEEPEAITRIDHYLYNWAEGGDLPWSVFTGNPLQFTAPKAHTLRSVSVAFSPIQDLHGQDAPYPAGGGANKLNPNTFTGYSSQSISFTLQDDGSFKITGTAGSSGWCFIEQSVSLSDLGLTVGDYVYFYGSPRIYVFCRQGTTSLGGKGAEGTVESIQIPADCDNLRICCYAKTDQITQGEVISTTGKYQISTASFSSWTPYSNLCPISGWTALDVYDEPDYDPTAQPMTTLSFGTTVYGGTAEVAEDGSVTRTATMAEVDMGSLSWGYNSSYGFITTSLRDSIKNAPDFSTKGNLVCSIFKTDTYGSITGNQTNYCIGVSGGNYGYVVVSDSDYTDKDSFTTAVTGQKLVYELATPIVIHLDPVEPPKAVQGINTIWSDSNGDVTVEAKAEAVNLNALQSLNMLLGGRYVNNHTEEDLADEEALDVLLGNR